MRALKIAVLGFCVIYFIFSCVLAYWYFETPPELKIPIPFVRSVDQYKGIATLLDVPIHTLIDQKANQDLLEIQFRLVDAQGNIRLSTPYEKYDRLNAYKMLVSRRVPPGEYNLVVALFYRLNPINSKLKEVPIAVLNIVEKEDDDNRRPTEEIVSQP